VSGHSFVEPEFPEDAEGRSESPFQILPLFKFVVESGRAGKLGHLHLGLLGVQTRFQWGSDGGFAGAILMASMTVTVCLGFGACC